MMTSSHVLLNPPLLEIAAHLFKQIREATDDGVGITRENYGRGETIALNLLADYATQ